GQRAALHPRRGAKAAARPLPARRARPHRDALGLRHVQLRSVRRLAGRRAGEVVHGPGGDGVRQGGPHRGGPGEGRGARPRPEGLHGVPRAPVRVLHPRDDDDGAVAARPPPGPDRGGDPGGAVGPDLPVHRLREHRPLRPLGRRAPRRQGRGSDAMSENGQHPNGQHPDGQGGNGHHGFGRVPRKEDARFIRGRGNYVDDIKQPGIHHGAILRSPHAHARLVSVDTTAAEAHPQVRAVITGETLTGLNLAWMPTLSNDVQAVLATDKVRYQGQEVAFVVAETHYAARDALELIDVDYEVLPCLATVKVRYPGQQVASVVAETLYAARDALERNDVDYEPLPPVVDARKALDDDAPDIRDDVEGRTDNHIFDWEAGDAEHTD